VLAKRSDAASTRSAAAPPASGCRSRTTSVTLSSRAGVPALCSKHHGSERLDVCGVPARGRRWTMLAPPSSPKRSRARRRRDGECDRPQHARFPRVAGGDCECGRLLR
jgi:hypothetical protein